MDQEGTAVIPTTMFDRLVELGRRHGALQSDDIRQALPVDTMTIEEIVDVLTRLEEAGIAVEIDPALLTPRHRKINPEEVRTATKTPPPGEQEATRDARLSRLASSIKAARGGSSRTTEPASKFVKMPGTTFILVAALILLILALAVWRFA